MYSRRRLLHLVIFLSLSVLAIIHFYTHSSSHLISPSNLHQNPNPFNSLIFTFTIELLAFDRLASLSRCLRSLAAADYGADRVNLHVFIDHFAENGKNQGLDGMLNVSHRILSFIDEFSWRFWEKFVHYRTRNVGLQAQWLEAWWPGSDHEFAFVVEDDLEVSPLYYRFLKALVLNHYYNSSNFSPFVYGASLQRPRFVPGIISPL